MPPIEALLSIQTLLFLAFALGAVATAVALVLHPNPLRAGLFLVLNLFCVAVLYLLLNAYFLAAVQVIVYAGAIMVLFLFVIMLLNLGSPDRTVDRLKWQTPAAVVAGLALASVFGGAILFSVPYNAPANKSLVPSAAEQNAALVEQDAALAEAKEQRRAQGLPEGPTAAGMASGGGAARQNDGEAAALLPSDASVLNTQSPPDTMGTAEGIGQILYNPFAPWLFPFEMTSILLLIAVIGSVVLAKRRTANDDAATYAEGKSDMPQFAAVEGTAMQQTAPILSNAPLGVPLSWYLIVSALLFTVGAVGVLVKRNPIVIFMCIELMLNAVNLSFIAFGRYVGHSGGMMFSVFVMAVAAAEVAVGLGILISIFRSRENINVDEINVMRG